MTNSLSSLLCLMGITLAAHAQLPQAKLTSIFPPGGKAGAEIELTVAGADLDELGQMVFSHTGITSKSKPGANGLPEANKFLVSIAASVPPGIYEARVTGRFGISNPRGFAVGTLLETNEPTTNNSFANAVELALNSTVNGRSDANSADFFRFTAKKGQRVIIECLARELDSRMSPSLVLYAEGAREVERNRRGGLLDFTAPADGQFVLKVHDFVFGGGEQHPYRLTVSTGPRVDYILPPSGLPGTKGRFTLFGRNLPGGTPAPNVKAEGKALEQLSVDIEIPGDALARQRLATSGLVTAPSAVVDGFDYRLVTAQGTANPVLITFATAPVIAEQEPNSTGEQAQKISPPCEITGQFYPAGDQDVFTFEAKKGDAYSLDVFSQRLGLPTNPFLLVQRVTKNEKGEEQLTDVLELDDVDTNLGGPEFNTATRDPAGRFEASQDGTYRITVRDLFNRSESIARHVYRLSIRKESPDFRLVALATALPGKKDAKDLGLGTPILRRGETLPIRVIAFRRDGFTGDIALSLEGLPPGVTCASTKIESGKTIANVLLSASAEAPNFVGPVKVIGKAKVGDTELLREARGGSVMWNVTDPALEAVSSRMTKTYFLAVCGSEAAPVTVGPVEKNVFETSVAGKLKIPLNVTRRYDFTANLSLKATGVTVLDPMKELAVDAKATNVVLELDLTAQKLPVGEHTFYLTTLTQGKYRNNPEGAKAADDAAKAMDKTITDLKAAEKSANEKLATAKSAAEKTPTDAALVAAKAAAEKAAAEATAKVREAEAKKTMLASKATEAAKVAQPKDVSVTVYSQPITVKVAAAPITLAAPAPAGLSQGTKLEIPVSITRLFGYADSVDLTITLPSGVKGISAAKVTIAKDQKEAKLILEAAADATPGEHKVTVQAALKLNGTDLKVEQPVALKLAAVEKPKAK